MAVLSKEKLENYLALLSGVILDCRALAREEKNLKQIWAMLDAVHNIPALLAQWERCDENYLLENLRDYEKKWRNTPSGKFFKKCIESIRCCK